MIPQIEPWIDKTELQLLEEVIQSTFITEGNMTKKFEGWLRDYTGSQHVIAMANGTVALYSILKALDIGPGDEVIVPDMTFIATANSVIFAGATPVFCDIDPVTLCIDVKKAKPLINRNTRAIIPVHLYGLSAAMDEICQLCESYNLFLIEDAAQGVGVRYKGKHVGTFGEASILSFYGNKTITSAEGGAVLTDSEEIAAECYRLKNHGRDKKGIFIHEKIGFNFCFTDLQAAIGVAQLSKLERIIQKKTEIREHYIQSLADLSQIRFQTVPSHILPVFWFTNIYLDDVLGLEKHLKKNNIGSRRFFYPLHKQPCYHDLKTMDCPVSLMAYRTGLSLPSSYGLTGEHLDIICNAIKGFFYE